MKHSEVHQNWTIRPARIEEHVALTELALRSVRGGWGYSDEFMAWEPEAIIVVPDHIRRGITNVLESDGRVLGFYVLRGERRRWRCRD